MKENRHEENHQFDPVPDSARCCLLHRYGGRSIRPEIREWLAAKGECGDCMLLLKIHDVMVDVLALAGDETDQITMYSGGETEIILNFMNNDQSLKGYWIVIANPEYNEYEGNVEMKNWETLRLIPGDI